MPVSLTALGPLDLWLGITFHHNLDDTLSLNCKTPYVLVPFLFSSYLLSHSIPILEPVGDSAL